MTTTYNLNKFSPNSFSLVLPNVPGYGTKIDQLILTLNGGNIPSIELPSKDMHWMGGKTPIPDMPLNFGPFNISFLLDNDLTNWFILFKWLMFLNNNKDKYVEEDLTSTCVQASLIITDSFGNPSKKLTFTNLFITSLGEVTLDFRNANNYASVTASFNYTRFELVD